MWGAPGRAVRCKWARSPSEVAYHDEEWGVPQHDDRRLFEFLVLEGAQAGLSWRTILERREGYRRAFGGFDPRAVSGYGARDEARLMSDARIVRNRAKVRSAINNAARLLEVQSEFGSFDEYLWRGRDPTVNRFSDESEVPASTPASEELSADLRRRGFTFVGPVICYSLMQAVGVVNDHVTGCFRHPARARRRRARRPRSCLSR